MKKVTIFTAIFLCLAGMAYGQWTYTELSEPKEFMGSVSVGNKVYFAGGYNGSEFLDEVQVYDVSTKTWGVVTGGLFHAREFPGGSVACGSKVFFAGGFNWVNAFNTVDIYDTETEEWTVEFLSDDRFSIAAVNHGTKVMFAGGVDYPALVYKNVVDIYDTQTGNWTTTNLSIAREGIAAAVVGDLALFAGGKSDNGFTARVDIYDFTTGTWSIATLSQARGLAIATTVGNKVIIAGGAMDSNISTDRVDIYDASDGTWTTASLSVPRAAHHNAVTIGGKAYFVGGGKFTGSGFSNPSDVIDVYDEASNTWSVMNLHTARVQHSVNAVGNYLVVAGGRNNSGPLSSVEIYSEESSSCLPEGITFTTQEQIDNFQINYPGCSDILGDIVIQGNSITNLNGLNVLHSVAGNLTIIYNLNLSNLNGLNNLEVIGGFLYIVENTSLTSLTGLEGLVSVGDWLQIRLNDLLPNLLGLNNLQSVGGLLAITDNGIINLEGLGNLSSIGGDFGISSSPALLSLSGLNSLTSIGGMLLVGENPLITSLAGLENISANSINKLKIYINAALSTCDVQSICEYLASPGGTIEIHDNAPGCNSPEEVEAACEQHCLPEGITFSTQPQIDNFQINYPGCSDILGDIVIEGNSITNLNGLNVLQSVAGNLTIMYNPNLSNLNGLNNLEAIGGYLYIIENTSLTSLTGLEGLVSVGDWLQIMHIDLLPNLLGLNNLQTIGGKLAIVHNDGIINLEGLGNLSSIGGDFAIAFSPALLSLTGLNSLTTIGGILGFQQNPLITSLAGLENINANSVTDLKIYINASLSTCDVQSICEYLASPGGTIEIHDNAPGCNSPEEVIDACLIQVEEVGGVASILIIPNPASDWITISIEEGIVIRQITLTNRLGQEVYIGLPENNRLDVSRLSPGLYILSVLTNRGEVKQKVIIE